MNDSRAEVDMLREVLAAPSDHSGVRQSQRYVAKRLSVDLLNRIKHLLAAVEQRRAA